MRKKRAIWGAGTYGGRFSKKFEKNEIDFFIDQDINRKGEKYCNKSIKHPSEISRMEWENIYVYIPFNYCEEISLYLDERGLKKETDFSVYGHTLYISKGKADKEEKRYFDELKRFGSKGIIPIFANSWTKHGYENYFKHIIDAKEDYLLISEEAPDVLENKAGLLGINAPIYVDYETIVDYESDFDDNQMELLDLLDEATVHLQGFFPKDSYGVCKYSAWRKIKFIIDTLDILKCNRVLAFSSVTVEHSILQKICERKGIKIIYTHAGIIHGTLSFDASGEVGESVPAIFYDRFKSLYVSDSELAQARKVKEYLKQTRMNRKVQPKSFDISEVVLKYENRPIVFFAGQNDVGSHMIPYDERAKKNFSPIFSSSLEAAKHVADLCEKNRWNFIYKPHPMYVHTEERKELPSGAIYIDYADINDVIDMSDIVVTILSTTNYDAIIRDKPVIMLGYMQSKGKGFDYEAFHKDEIEPQIKRALEDGLTNEMKDAFVKHLAQCLKYYLYDNQMDREIRYGKEFPDSFDGFFDLYNMLKD